MSNVLSYRSLPVILSVLKYLTLFFYGCEIMSSLFWMNMKSIRKYLCLLKALTMNGLDAEFNKILNFCSKYRCRS